MEYIIREMKSEEYPLLDDFLYEAIFQQDETNLVPKSIIKNPELQIYINEFGKKKDDYCLCAEVNGQIVGAVWVRNIRGYGSIDNITPELSISLYRDFRGCGIGTKMMKMMLAYLKKAGYCKISLAVQKENYAFKMYLNIGFEVIHENEEEYIMVYKYN
ncbi:MAG: N-acetyltransferase family protein [Solirubrobacterales bacterium]